jgi:pyruvate, water dikinase
MRRRFFLADPEVLDLTDYALRIEDHYSKLAGHPEPTDIEWANDGVDGKLYIVQARPETVASQRKADSFETFALKGIGRVLVSGRAVGERIAAGTVRVIRDEAGLAAFRRGEVLVAESTSPDWESAMKTAGAIVTSRGGRTCQPRSWRASLASQQWSAPRTRQRRWRRARW